MACAPTPTSTLFGSSEIVTNSISTSTSTSVSTLPPSTVTTTTTSCVDPALSSLGSCSSETTITLTSTVPGSTTTITNQIPVTVPVTLTTTFPTETLFSTCPPNQSSQSPTNSGSSESGSPSVFTSASESTLPNGQMTVTIITFTSSQPQQTVFVPSSQSPGLNDSGNTSNTSSSNLAPIIGGVLGGFFGLILFVGALVCWRRRRRWEDIYEKESAHGIDDDDDRPIQAPEPAPYHYGLVGHHPSPSISPPSSPTSRPVTYHSRVNSSAGVSVVSRESTVPLKPGDSLMAPPPDVHRPSSHSRRPSQGTEALLLMRPLDPNVQPSSSSDAERRSFPSNAPGSPTSPRQTFSPLRITNADESNAGTSFGLFDQPGSPKRTQMQSNQSAVIIHTDGGRIGTEPTPEDQPPAYRKRA